MVLERDELAARCLVALIRTVDSEVRLPDNLAGGAVKMADALLSRLRPAAPVASESPRPEWVRITGPKDAVKVTVGKAYRVTGWHDEHGGGPIILTDETREPWHLYPEDKADSVFPSWEPCPAPSSPPCHGECDTPPPGRCSTGCAPDERPVSSPPSCEAPEPPATYVPKVGDFVTWGTCRTVCRVEEVTDEHFRVAPVGDTWVSEHPFNLPRSEATRMCLRPASASERAAAGLPPAEREGRSPECREAADQATFDEAKERAAAVGAWTRKDEAVRPRKSFIAGWLARARAAAPEATRSVDREGLRAALQAAYDSWIEDHADKRNVIDLHADAAVAFLGGAK